jgi:hypothetical protein
MQCIEIEIEIQRPKRPNDPTSRRSTIEIIEEEGLGASRKKERKEKIITSIHLEF